jgi:hypothetical protein
MSQNRDKHTVRRIVLPSGRAIDVVRFEQPEQQQWTKPALHICPKCESHLVQPVAWADVDSDKWELTLRCPNCHWTVSGVFDHDQVAALEEQLDEGVAAIIRDLKRLTHANMAEEIDRLDLILPEDF